MAKKKLTVKELEATRKGINKDEEDEKKAKAQGVKTSAPVYTYKDTNVTASDVAKKFNVQLPNKNASTGSNNAPGANAKAPVTSAAYTNKVADMFEKSKLYAAQGPDYVIDLANSIISGAATKPDKGNLGALDIDSIHDMTKISSEVARMLTDAGIFNTREIATNPLYAHLAQQEYRKSLLPTLQGELINSQQADEANKAAQAEYEAKLKGLNADYAKQAEKAAQWKNFFSLLGENPTLEDKLRAAGIATGQTYDMGVFRGMDKYTAYEKKLALDEWFAGLDAAALSAAPVVEKPEAPKYTSKTAGIEDEIGTLEKYINAYQTLEELTAFARSNPDFAAASVYNAPVYEEPSVLERMFVQEMGGAYADDALAAYINGQPMMPQFMRDPRSEDFYKRWEEQGYNYMLDQDKEIWNVLRKMDPAKADAYLQALSLIYLLPTRAQGYRSWDETVATNPWTAAPAWAGSVLQGVGNILDVPKQFAEAWYGVDNPYSAAFDNLNRQGNTRGAQLGAIRESDMPDWLKTASEYAYQGVSGFADNTARLLATGMNPTASLIMAGLQASSHSLHESAGRDDVSSAAKIIKAIGAGAIEVGTEKIGLDALFDMGKTGAKKYLSVVLSELGEESLNATSEPALEAVVAFLFDHEADIKSGPEFFENLKDTAITTFISATLSGGGAVASDYLDTRSYGKGIVNNGDVDTIMNVGKSMPENSESKRVYDEITGKQGKGKKPSFYQFGQLTKALIKDLGAEHADIIDRVQDEAIAGRLQELGDDAETAKKNAPIIRKVYRGEKLTMDERAAVRWNDRADKVTKELIRENNYTGDQPVPIKWVKGMKETQASESADVIGKQLQVQVATVTPIGKAANRAEEAAKKRVPKRDGKPKLATDSHVTFRAADGSTENSGNFMRFEESDEGMQVVVQTGNGKEGEQKAKLKDWISADGDGVATILSYVGDDQLPHSVTAEEANTLMQVYKNSGGNAKAVIQAFDVNYLAGYSGNNQVGSVLDPGLAKIAYENGKRDAEKDEAQRKQRASEYKALENPVAGWIGKVDGREQVKGLGDAKALEEALQAMPESQRTAAEIMIETGKAVGLNVVLYDSDGKGAENDIQNGMFDAVTHTVYFDVSAWAGNEKRVQALKKEGTLGYAMLRVGGHELTHYLEVAAPEAYAKYSKAVKEALKAKGVDFAVQMRERIDKANAQGRKLTMAGAAAEVIADASEYMLQDSKLFNNLDTDTKGKIRAFLQNFAQKVKEIFQHLTSGHKESAALREMKNGVHHYLEGLQDLWDAGFDEILAKGTEEQSGGAAEMVDSIPVEELEATRKFSMGRDVELREDGLIAMHNLKESDVRGTLALGGFPMPSIAIVKAKDGHTMYGDYSVLFGKETIDPANKKNRVYGADAWTPVFPHVETQIHDDILYDVQEGFRDLAAQVDEEYGKKARIWFGNFSGSDVTTKSLDDIAESAANNTGVMAAYLADHGETVEVVETDAPVDQGYKPEHADQYDKILDIIDMNDYFNMPMHELLDTYGDRLAEVSGQLSRLNAHWKTGDRRSGAAMARVLQEAIAYEGSGRDKTVKTKRVKDYYATDDAIRARVDRKDVEAWAKEKLAPAFGEQGIYNGKDRFTPSGNRRSFKQTHNALTADNVVKSMLTQEESAIPVTDAKGLMAAAASMYKSIAEIKGDVNRLGKISEEEYNARIAAADNAFRDFLNAIEAWDYDQIQDVGKLLVQAAKGRMDAKAISALLKRNGFPKATIKASIMAENVIQQVQNIPTGYFEAKPARVVGFDEIRMIVAPDTMPESLAALLDKHGIPYTTYDGSDADRLEKVNAVEGVRFSDREQDQTETEAFKRWFGDSVVVNEDGTPKVMYHGSKENFTVFDKSILRDKLGFFFTEDKREAQDYGTARSFYLSIKNPYDIWDGLENYGKTSEEKVKGLKDAGYDGIISYSHGTTWYIAFEPTQIKSATDNVGTFDPENPDIRYSDRDLPDGVTIREYLGAMKPTSSMTETEKLLLKRYQDQLRTMEEKEKLVEEQEEIIRTAPFRNPDGSLNDEITKAKNRYKIYRDQANRAARALANAEKDEGFARLMATSRQVVNDYLLGAAGNVADAQDVLETEINELTRQLTKLEADVTRTSQGQRTAFARGLYNPDDLKAAAQKLKDTYGSRMSVQNIANRLALAYGELYANEGTEGAKLFMAASRDLATDLLAGNKFRYKSEILPMLREQIGTISLSDTDLQEIGNAGLTVTEYKRALSPYIKVSAEGSDLSSYASNAEYYGNGALAAVLSDENEGNLAMRLYDVISQEKAKEADNGYDGMSESQLIGMAMADIAGANLPMSANSSTVEYLRKELLKYAGENAEVAITVEEAISKAKKATAKAGRIWLEAAKNTETARQAVEYYRALDEKRRVMELAEQKKQITEQLKSDTAKKLQEKVTAQREEYREREKKAREYRKARVELDKVRKRISRNVKAINALRVRETDKKHVPQQLQYMADLMMQTFTDTNLGRLAFPQEKLHSLSRTYRLLLSEEVDATHYWDDEIEAELDNLVALSEAYNGLKNKKDGVPSVFTLEGVEYETEILRGVDNVVANILNMIDAWNDNFLRNRTGTFETFANQTGEKLRVHDDYKVKKGLMGKVQTMLDETIRTGNMTPVYFFDHLHNQELLDVFDEIREGMHKAAMIEREGKEYIERVRANRNYGKWVADGKLKMKTGNGHIIELTREEACEIYAIAKREAANKLYQTEHLLYGGFQYKHIDQHVAEDGKTLVQDIPNQLDKADLEKIGNWLTAEQKAYADDLVGFLSTTMADYGNAASMEMYGYNKFTESYYIPFKTVAEQRYLRGDEGPQGENAGTGRLLNSGFTHKVQHKANATLYVGGISETVAEHIHKMAAYSAMVQPIENLKRLLNHKVLENDGTSNTIRALIGQKYGKAAENYMTQLLKDLNGATQSDQRASAWTDMMVSAFKRGAVMASASVVLQQPTAMARAMAMISPKYFANNPFYRPGKGTWEEMLKHSGTAVIKDMGKFDVGMGKTSSQYILDEDLNVAETYQRLKEEGKTKAGKAALDRFIDWLTSAPGVADQWTWGLIWKAVKAEQAALHPNMDQTSDEFLDMVGKRFDEVVDHTQVYDSVLTKSNLMRSQNGFHKMATSFMAEPTLSINMLYDALTGKHGKKQAARIIGSVAASQVLAGALAALVQAWNDDDDERNWLEKYADRASSNIFSNINVFGMIPYVSDIVSLFEGYDVERPDLSMIADLMDYTQKYFKAFADGGMPSWKDTENFVGTLANLAGVPAKNISREIRRTRNAVFNTNWNAPDTFNVGQVISENTIFNSGKNKEYYQRIVTADLRGDVELAENLREYMLTSKMVTPDKLRSEIKTALKEAYIDGDTDDDTAIDMLVEIGAYEDRDDAYWEVDKWKYMQETGASADSYSKYNDFYTAVETGKDLKKTIQEYLDNGASKSTLAGKITSQYKPQMIALKESGKGYADLQARILTAYEALGYDRQEKLKDIQKWFKTDGKK